ncbi:MAG: hypothetical protein JWR26_4930 [Pedosphaera sp.]|nr:hypothetical protein [Pedosphaera sp.]
MNSKNSSWCEGAGPVGPVGRKGRKGLKGPKRRGAGARVFADYDGHPGEGRRRLGDCGGRADQPSRRCLGDAAMGPFGTGVGQWPGRSGTNPAESRKIQQNNGFAIFCFFCRSLHGLRPPSSMKTEITRFFAGEQWSDLHRDGWTWMRRGAGLDRGWQKLSATSPCPLPQPNGLAEREKAQRVWQVCGHGGALPFLREGRRCPTRRGACERPLLWETGGCVAGLDGGLAWTPGRGWVAALGDERAPLQPAVARGEPRVRGGRFAREFKAGLQSGDGRTRLQRRDRGARGLRVWPLLGKELDGGRGWQATRHDPPRPGVFLFFCVGTRPL